MVREKNGPQPHLGQRKRSARILQHFISTFFSSILFIGRFAYFYTEGKKLIQKFAEYRYTNGSVKIRPLRSFYGSVVKFYEDFITMERES